MPKISIVIPAYNEEARLPLTIEALTAFAERPDIEEVLFVDDGSNDRTKSLIETAEKEHERLHAISYRTNSGKGYAVRRGILEARGDLVLVCDADLSTPLSELDKLLPLLETTDLVIGSRALDETTVKESQPAYRQGMGKIFNRLMTMITGLDFRDTQCGFKLIRADVAREVARSAIVDRFAWDVEFLMIACSKGYRIAEIPVLWFNSPESRVRVIQDSLRMLMDLLAMRKRIGKVECKSSQTPTN